MTVAEETREGFYLSEEEEWVPDVWIQSPLEKIGLLTTGKTPAKANPHHWGKVTAFITPTDFNGERSLRTPARRLSLAGKEAFKNQVVPSESIAVSCIGSDMGKVVLLREESLTNQQINTLTADSENHSLFWYYAITADYPRLRSIAEGGGSTMPLVNKGDFSRLVYAHPKIDEQKAIAAVLGSLDDKIELLREQNETLEALAQTLFKRWFIDFNFPDENGNPYKDSGGKMIASELGEIPEGWAVQKLRDFGAIVCGKTPSKKIPEYFGEDVPFIKIPDMHGNTFINVCGEYLSHTGADSQRKKTVPANSIIVSCIATVGLVSMTIRNSQTNQQINTIVPNKKIATEYLYLRIKTLYDFLQNLGAGGSATLNINTSSFSEVEVVSPAQSQLEKFHNLTGKLFTKIKTNCEQIQTLTQLRDTLLPKLMKGEIRVPVES